MGNWIFEISKGLVRRDGAGRWPLSGLGWCTWACARVARSDPGWYGARRWRWQYGVGSALAGRPGRGGTVPGASPRAFTWWAGSPHPMPQAALAWLAPTQAGMGRAVGAGGTAWVPPSQGGQEGAARFPGLHPGLSPGGLAALTRWPRRLRVNRTVLMRLTRVRTRASRSLRPSRSCRAGAGILLETPYVVSYQIRVLVSNHARAARSLGMGPSWMSWPGAASAQT